VVCRVQVEIEGCLPVAGEVGGRNEERRGDCGLLTLKSPESTLQKYSRQPGQGWLSNVSSRVARKEGKENLQQGQRVGRRGFVIKTLPHEHP
jgi:hypothetical protein